MYKLCNDTQEKSFLPSQYGIRALTSTIKRGFSLCCTGLSKLVFFFSFLSFLLSSLQQIKISLLSTVPKCNHLVYTAYKVSFIHFTRLKVIKILNVFFSSIFLLLLRIMTSLEYLVMCIWTLFAFALDG